jgi:hypothetical protein
MQEVWAAYEVHGERLLDTGFGSGSSVVVHGLKSSRLDRLEYAFFLVVTLLRFLQLLLLFHDGGMEVCLQRSDEQNYSKIIVKIGRRAMANGGISRYVCYITFQHRTPLSEASKHMAHCMHKTDERRKEMLEMDC